MNEHSFVKDPSGEENGVLRFCGGMCVQLAPNGVRGPFCFESTLGMWIDRIFTEVLGENASLETGSIKVGKYQLQKRTHNSDILRTIGEKGIYRGEEGKKALKQIIASSIFAQWQGGPGLFLLNAQSNLFYFEQSGIRYGIRVFRMTIVPEWDVNMWKMDNNWWDAGDAVFTPAVDDG